MPPFSRGGVAHYRREKEDHTYQILLDCVDRYTDDFTLEHNRAVQAAEYGTGNKSLAVKKGTTSTTHNSTTPATNTKGNGKSSRPRRRIPRATAIAIPKSWW